VRAPDHATFGCIEVAVINEADTAKTMIQNENEFEAIGMTPFLRETLL
jgi:hypothetical protein